MKMSRQMKYKTKEKSSWTKRIFLWAGKAQKDWSTFGYECIIWIYVCIISCRLLHQLSITEHELSFPP